MNSSPEAEAEAERSPSAALLMSQQTSEAAHALAGALGRLGTRTVVKEADELLPFKQDKQEPFAAVIILIGAEDDPTREVAAGWVFSGIYAKEPRRNIWVQLGASDEKTLRYSHRIPSGDVWINAELAVQDAQWDALAGQITRKFPQPRKNVGEFRPADPPPTVSASPESETEAGQKPYVTLSTGKQTSGAAHALAEAMVRLGLSAVVKEVSQSHTLEQGRCGEVVIINWSEDDPAAGRVSPGNYAREPDLCIWVQLGASDEKTIRASHLIPEGHIWMNGHVEARDKRWDGLALQLKRRFPKPKRSMGKFPPVKPPLREGPPMAQGRKRELLLDQVKAQIHWGARDWEVRKFLAESHAIKGAEAEAMLAAAHAARRKAIRLRALTPLITSGIMTVVLTFLGVAMFPAYIPYLTRYLWVACAVSGAVFVRSIVRLWTGRKKGSID